MYLWIKLEVSSASLEAFDEICLGTSIMSRMVHAVVALNKLSVWLSY